MGDEQRFHVSRIYTSPEANCDGIIAEWDNHQIDHINDQPSSFLVTEDGGTCLHCVRMMVGESAAAFMQEQSIKYRARVASDRPNLRPGVWRLRKVDRLGGYDKEWVGR